MTTNALMKYLRDKHSITIGGSSDKRNLIVLSTLDENLIFASRNLQNVIVTTVENLSVYDVLNSSKLIMFKDTFAEEKEAK